MFMSLDSNRIGLQCGNQMFIYEVSSNTVISRKTIEREPGPDVGQRQRSRSSATAAA